MLTLHGVEASWTALEPRFRQLAAGEAELAELGRQLFKALFHGSLKDLYLRSRRMLGAGQGLRLKLDIAASPVVGALPWEFLDDPAQGPLALLDTPVVRYLPQHAPLASLRCELPLRILLTAAHTPPPAEIERELQAVRAALASLGAFVEITVEPHLTPEKLQALLRQPFHVWHFVGHGGFTRDGADGRLALEDAVGDVAFIDAPELAVLLGGSQLRLVVLDACQGGQLAVDPLRSLAPALIRARIPAVIAMQLTVPEETTRVFAVTFYQALAEGFPVDACATEGRKAVMGAYGLERPDWGIPVVYTHSPDGLLFELPPAPKPACPYPGMVPFRAEDTRFFYGREAEIAHVIRLLREERLCCIVGPSGSGKSSLVRAGLLPRLEAGAPFPDGFWLIRQFRPTSRPLEVLQQALEGEITRPGEAVSALLTAHPPAQRLLLVIDQFEELFTQVPREAQRAFVTALNALRQIERCTLLFSLRADFYPELITSDLWPIDAHQRLEIAPLRGAALRQSIERPAADVQVRLEPGLVERVLADAADEPGVLPLIQETMVVLWERMPRRLMLLQTYLDLGRDGLSGLAVAIAAKADATLEALPAAQQVLARRILLRLIQFGEGRADTRRQQPIAALRSAEDDTTAFDQTLAHLADNRLLTLRGEDDTSEPTADISHEALINGWPTLRRWVHERREAEQTRRRLEAKAAEWTRFGQGDGGLLDAHELLEAERWLASADAAELGYDRALPAFVEASAAALAAARQQEQAAQQRELEQANALAREAEARTKEARRYGRRMTCAVVGLTLMLVIACASVAILGFGLVAYQGRFQMSTSALGQIYSVRYSPDQRFLLAVDGGSTINIWNLAEKRIEHTLVGHEQYIDEVIYSHDGRHIASYSLDGIAKIWDAGTGVELHTVRGHTQFLNHIAFSPDDTKLITASDDGSARVWDVQTGEKILALIHTGPVSTALYSSDGTAIFTRNGVYFHIWDARSGEHRREIKFEGYFGAVSPDGQTLVTVDDTGSATLWALPAGTERATLQAPSGRIAGVAFSPDQRTIATTNRDGTAQTWDATTGRLQLTLHGYAQVPSRALYSADGRHILTIGLRPLPEQQREFALKIWDATTGELTHTIHKLDSDELTISPDGQLVAIVIATSGTDSLTIWDIAAGEELITLVRRISRSIVSSGQGLISAWNNDCTRKDLSKPRPPYRAG